MCRRKMSDWEKNKLGHLLMQALKLFILQNGLVFVQYNYVTT